MFEQSCDADRTDMVGKVAADGPGVLPTPDSIQVFNASPSTREPAFVRKRLLTQDAAESMIDLKRGDQRSFSQQSRSQCSESRTDLPHLLPIDGSET